MPASEVRGARRTLVPLLVLAAVLLPSLVAGVPLWRSTGADLVAAATERAGLAVLRPLLGLVVATSDAQSAAVRERSPDARALRDSLARVDDAVRAHGEQLGVGQRWAAVRTELLRLEQDAPTGGAAYGDWSRVTDLELSLTTAVGDAAGLTADPGDGSRRLAQASVTALPLLVVDAGRVSDLTLLLESRKVPQTADTVAAAVLGDRVRSAAASAVEDLRSGYDDATGRPLEPVTLRRIDGLQAVAGRLAPPLGDIGATPVTRSADDVEAARGEVRAAVVAAADAVLPAVDSALTDRIDARWTVRWLVAGAVTGGLALVLVAAWVAAPRPRTARADDAAAEAVDDGDVAADLLEARDLLFERRLVRVGRAVAPVRAPDRDGAGAPEQG